MQMLGLSESTPKPENRFKTLFWPRVRYAEDVEVLGAQAFWVCVMLAAFTGLAELSSKHSLLNWLDVLFYCLAGIGIRQTSRFAATSVFAVYLLSVAAEIKIAHRGGIASIIFLALLFSSVRATWLAQQIIKETGPRLSESHAQRSLRTQVDDLMPRLIWPIGKWLYYGLTLLMLIGFMELLLATPVHQALS